MLVDLVDEEFEVEFKRLEEFKYDVFYNGKSHIYEGSNEEEVLIPLMKNFEMERKKNIENVQKLFFFCFKNI